MPLTIEDKFTITELIHRLNHLLDARDTEAALSCFTPDFRVVIPEGTLSAADYRRMLETVELEVPQQHWAGNIWVEGDGDRATAKTYVLSPEGPRADGGFGIFLMGKVDYDVVRVDGEWLFEQLTIERDKHWDIPE